MDGIFISFEGIDGAGKSTHVEALAKALREGGREVVQTREPGGTPLAEALREMVLHQSMDSMTEVLLVFAARRDHIRQVIAPALAQGKTVLCDRFTDATFAYQGAGRGFNWSVLEQLEQWVQLREQQGGAAGTLQPSLTIWFDLPAEVAAQRLINTRVPDRFESQPREFFEAVSSGYRRRFDAHPDRMARIDANQSAGEVWMQVLDVVRNKGWLA